MKYVALVLVFGIPLIALTVAIEVFVFEPIEQRLMSRAREVLAGSSNHITVRELRRRLVMSWWEAKLFEGAIGELYDLGHVTSVAKGQQVHDDDTCIKLTAAGIDAYNRELREKGEIPDPN